MQDTAGEAGTSSYMMYSYGPPHMAGQKQDDQHEHTFSSYVRIRDVALKTCQRQWTIGRSGERGSGISASGTTWWWWWNSKADWARWPWYGNQSRRRNTLNSKGWRLPGQPCVRHAMWVAPPQPNQVMGPVKKMKAGLKNIYYSICVI